MRSMSMSIKGRSRFFGIGLPVLPDVTRRIHARPYKQGDHFHAIERGMGIPKGGHQVIYAECKVVSAVWEPLGDIITRPRRPGSEYDEVTREGFPDLTPEKFCAMVIRAHSGKHLTLESPVLRYEYVHVRDGNLL